MLPKPVGVEPDSQIQGSMSSILIWNHKYKLVNPRFWWQRSLHYQILLDYLSIVSWSNIAFSCASSASLSLVLLSFSASEYFSSNSSIFFFSSLSSPYITHLCKSPVTYEARVLQKWSHTCTGYFLGYLYSWGASACVPQVYPNFSTKKKNFFHFFFWICHKNR